MFLLLSVISYDMHTFLVCVNLLSLSISSAVMLLVRLLKWLLTALLRAYYVQTFVDLACIAVQEIRPSR